MNKWEPPKLIVLVRSNPEEAVLDGCKMLDEGSVSPAETVTGCHEAT